ncbi:hypothetical protein M899_2538 [Bacteriovorax sp. BSW11_IV]|uniref:hypothetical protein n=1 Tax=Bacteriovorax sp. BSW11_IV TaxID=1353529 RepID=UPI00038A5311|nr:hypothetical protein [Bacteriovorax sp. BSW11_IV]EQC50343.1 hypothetical protein M899_2538 [Bacteriovorax sp. BSW11_IV]
MSTFNDTTHILNGGKFFLNNEPEKRILELENKAELLKKLCHEIDPYSKITEEQKVSLETLEIVQFDDPFLLTNQLLLLTEDTLEELEELKQKIQE